MDISQARDGVQAVVDGLKRYGRAGVSTALRGRRALFIHVDHWPLRLIERSSPIFPNHSSLLGIASPGQRVVHDAQLGRTRR
jgi:hypothetical protein